jgi:hypothetical protein
MAGDDVWKQAIHIFRQDTGIDLRVTTSKDISAIGDEHSLLLLLDVRLQDSKTYQKHRTALFDSLKPLSNFCTSAVAFVRPAANNVCPIHIMMMMDNPLRSL